MKTLIIYKSILYGNTKKIAEVIAETINADMLEPDEVDLSNITSYDLLGFGSGIYFSSHHKSILNLVKKLPNGSGKKAFVFSTSGFGRRSFNNELKNQLNLKGYQIISDFSSRGYDTFGPFKIIGGVAKGRPNAKDLERAKSFAEKLKNQLI